LEVNDHGLVEIPVHHLHGMAEENDRILSIVAKIKTRLLCDTRLEHYCKRICLV